MAKGHVLWTRPMAIGHVVWPDDMSYTCPIAIGHVLWLQDMSYGHGACPTGLEHVSLAQHRERLMSYGEWVVCLRDDVSERGARRS